MPKILKTMPKILKAKLLAAAAATLLLALPVTAEATLVFTRVPLQPVVWAANDDGSGAVPIGKGTYPRISPDGATVAYYRIQKAHGYRQEMVLSATDGSGSPRVLLPRWNEPFSFDWSPDSGMIVAVTGPELGKKRLVTIDVASGAQRTIANGYFSGVSFAPSGTELVYARSNSETYPPKVDLYKFSLATGKTARLTKDRRSQYPLWGPAGTIVFVKLLNSQQRRYGPKNELFLINESGGQVRRLTHTKVGALLSGLSPTQWSDSGNELLAEFGGQDTTYAVTVNPRTGAERTLTDERETGFVGTALSADGGTVLGSTGGFEPGPGHKVVTIPYAGGRQAVLANNASEPDWNR